MLVYDPFLINLSRWLRLDELAGLGRVCKGTHNAISRIWNCVLTARGEAALKEPTGRRVCASIDPGFALHLGLTSTTSLPFKVSQALAMDPWLLLGIETVSNELVVCVKGQVRKVEGKEGLHQFGSWFVSIREGYTLILRVPIHIEGNSQVSIRDREGSRKLDIGKGKVCCKPSGQGAWIAACDGVNLTTTWLSSYSAEPVQKTYSNLGEGHFFAVNSSGVWSMWNDRVTLRPDLTLRLEEGGVLCVAAVSDDWFLALRAREEEYTWISCSVSTFPDGIRALATPAWTVGETKFQLFSRWAMIETGPPGERKLHLMDLLRNRWTTFTMVLPLGGKWAFGAAGLAHWVPGATVELTHFEGHRWS